MKTTNKIVITAFSFLIMSHSTFGMVEQNTPAESTITSKIMDNLRHARDMTSYFFIKCYRVGVLATMYAALGIYDFKKISGLEENELNNYNKEELEKALARVDTMIQYSSDVQKLQEFSSKIQGKLMQAKLNKDIDLTADQTAALEEIQQGLQQ